MIGIYVGYITKQLTFIMAFLTHYSFQDLNHMKPNHSGFSFVL